MLLILFAKLGYAAIIIALIYMFLAYELKVAAIEEYEETRMYVDEHGELREMISEDQREKFYN